MTTRRKYTTRTTTTSVKVNGREVTNPVFRVLVILLILAWTALAWTLMIALGIALLPVWLPLQFVLARYFDKGFFKITYSGTGWLGRGVKYEKQLFGKTRRVVP